MTVLHRTITCLILLLSTTLIAQEYMTPELLWSLNRVSAKGITEDGRHVVYSSTTYDISDNSRTTKHYRIPLRGGAAEEIKDPMEQLRDSKISPDGKYKITAEDVKINDVTGADFYPDLEKSDAYIYDDLHYRHWDTWEDGAYSHVMLHEMKDGKPGPGKDIMSGEPYDCPLKPFGGSDDYLWNHDGTQVVYVAKKYFGRDYVVNTNSDIYAYDIKTGKTTNLTDDNPGYDTHPHFSKDGVMAWLRMDEAGYEADKNDIIVRVYGEDRNLTEAWDGTVNGFQWSNDGTTIYFTAPTGGTVQLFAAALPSSQNLNPPIRQITEGIFDVRGIVGQVDETLVVTRTDMNHASEIYTVNLTDGSMQKLTRANDEIYGKINLSKIDKRMVRTTDGKEMVTWVIYPPDFDPNKKYPTLLYCQGGPQGALSQFYSFRWNFQLMAAHGYVVVAPNRRGMPGYGVEWNEQISGDWGGQNMQDYLSAIDDVAKEPWADASRLGCVGASYGGYSAFFLAGMHEGRFKSFIAHDGVFNLRSMYGTTEELFFVNKDIGGPYWDKSNETARKSYDKFNPVEYVDKWTAPMLIIQGGKDYRVPIGQSLEAFQAAQLQGLRSKLLYFPEENHWVLTPQNGLVWQREFYKWLDETVKTPRS